MITDQRYNVNLRTTDKELIINLQGTPPFQ